MAQFASYMLALWHWIAVNGLAVVIAINVVVLVCAIGLAVHACAVSRRLKQVAIATARNTALINKVMKEIDAYPGTIESQTRHAVMKSGAGHFADASYIRQEIESLQEEIAATLNDNRCDVSRDISFVPVEIDVLARQARDEIESLKMELTIEEDAALPDEQ